MPAEALATPGVEAGHQRQAARDDQARPEADRQPRPGSPHAVLGLLAGRVEVSAARRDGLVYEGDESALARLQPPEGPEALAGLEQAG